jgi:pimeloyl-ACP methyl ester carboxylesterase
VAHVDVGSKRLEFEMLEGGGAQGAPTLVFLHEGLGSMALWKDFPRDVVAATGCNALVYSRYGYGSSTPLGEARDPGFMHEEALDSLPHLLDRLGIHDPILFGHSDGASIALIHAGAARRAVRGLIVMAPHVLVEDVCVASIGAVRDSYLAGGLREKLLRYHADPDGAFWGWCNVWLDPRFRAWNIERQVRQIACPLLAIQGFDDQYGTMEQVDRIARLVPSAELLKLESCGHSPHRDQPGAVVTAAARFIDRIVRGPRQPGPNCGAAFGAGRP